MKSFIRSKLFLSLISMILLASAIIVPLSLSLLHSHAASQDSTNSCAVASFSGPTNFAVGSSPFGIAVGNFNGGKNGKGNLDLAVANNGSDNVSILLGDGKGGFGAATNFPVGSSPRSVAVGDFDGDGTPDLAVVNNGSNTVSILLGDEKGGFVPATPPTHAVGMAPIGVVVGDFNGDGNLDLAVSNNGSKDVSILLGDGKGGFGPETRVGAGPSQLDAHGIAVGDFTGNGHLDLAVANHFFGTVSILLGDGNGNFPTRTDYPVVPFPESVAVGDFNGDGHPDLVVGSDQSNMVSVLLGDGKGGFGAATNFVAGAPATPGVAVGDFTGNGHLDLAVSNSGSNTVSILLGDGTGSFGAPTSFTVGSSPFSIAVGNFDGGKHGKGNPDLAVVNTASNNVSILLNNCEQGKNP